MTIKDLKKRMRMIIVPGFKQPATPFIHGGPGVGKSEAEIANSDIVIDRIQKEVAKYNKSFGKWEQIKRFELTPDIWSIDGGHLTPTMKMKRNIIKGIYSDLYDKIYRS
jgi:long-chain acyl-CoA synthetase